MQVPDGRIHLLDAVIHESKKQADTIVAMRSAFESGDEKTALEKARILAGLDPAGCKTSTLKARGAREQKAS